MENGKRIDVCYQNCNSIHTIALVSFNIYNVTISACIWKGGDRGVGLLVSVHSGWMIFTDFQVVAVLLFLLLLLLVVVLVVGICKFNVFVIYPIFVFSSAESHDSQRLCITQLLCRPSASSSSVSSSL